MTTWKGGERESEEVQVDFFLFFASSLADRAAKESFKTFFLSPF